MRLNLVLNNRFWYTVVKEAWKVHDHISIHRLKRPHLSILGIGLELACNGGLCEAMSISIKILLISLHCIRKLVPVAVQKRNSPREYGVGSEQQSNNVKKNKMTSKIRLSFLVFKIRYFTSIRQFD